MHSLTACRARHTSLALAALATGATLLSAPAHAQTSFGQPRPHAPTRTARYDFAQQTFQLPSAAGPGQTARTAAASSNVVVFENTNPSGFFSTPNTLTEWMDWGSFTATNQIETPICEFDIFYSSEDPDPMVTGVVDIEIAFFATDSLFAPLGDCNQVFYPGVGKGMEIGRFLITGLPGDDVPGDGLASSWEINVDISAIADGIALPSSFIGWSYTIISDPTLTGPTLMTPEVATGCNSPNFFGNPGTSDCFDAYTPPGASGICDPGGPFNFVDGGGFSLGIASFGMRFAHPATPSGAPVTVREGPIPNSGVLSLLSGSMTAPSGDQANFFSGPFFPELQVAVTTTPMGVGDPLVDFWALSTGPGAGIVLPGIGSILVDLPTFLMVTGLPGAPLSLPFGLPPACNLIGVPIFSQGGTVGTDSIGLTNALDFVIIPPAITK